MKNKRLFLVSLILLAFLIIGAASAADTPDLDESLAADNIEEVSADASFETDVISEGNDEIISSSDEDVISDEVDDIVDYSDEDVISDEVDDIVDYSDEDVISDGADKVLGDSEEDIVAIIVDSSEHFYNGDDEFIWVHLPIGLTGGYVTVEDSSALLIRAEFDESYWQEEEDGHYFCSFVTGDINWSDVGDGDTVTIKYVDEEEVIWNQSDYTVHFNGDLISFEEKNYGWDEFNPVISNEININDEDTVVEINTFYQGNFYVTVQDEYGREWSIPRGVNMEDDDDGYVRLNLEDLWIEETGIYFLTGKFVHYSEGEDGDVEIVFENHRLRVISNFYTNEGLITYKEVVGLSTDDRNLNTGRIVITDSYTGAVYFDKALADMKYNDSMMGYIYNQYHGYYVFAKDLENIGTGRHYITATYYNDDGSVNETSRATIFLDLDSCVNADEVDFRDLDAVLLKVYIFEMYEDCCIVFGERKEDEDGGEEFVTYFKSEMITASDVGKVLTFTLEDLGFEEGSYCGDLTIGDGLDDNSNYFYKIAFDKEIKIVDNSKFRIKMDDEVSLFNTDDVFFVYCPENSADSIITINVENEEHVLINSFYYHIIAEEAGGYIGLTLDELRVSNPGLYFFNILDFEEENELVEPFEYEFYNPLSTKDVCIVDDDEDNKIVELFVPKGFSEGSVIITDEDGIELFNKPLTQMEYYSEGYDGDFVRYYVTYDDLNLELEMDKTYKLTASYVGSKNFEVEWDVLFVKKTIAEKDGVSIELFDHWAHDLNDEEDRIARVFSPYNGDFDIIIGDWQHTFILEPDEGGYCREIYVGDIDVDPGTYLVTVIYYDDEIGEEFLSLSAEMEFIFDNDDRSEIIIFIDEEVNYPTTGEDVDDGFVAISVPAELEGSVIISANDEEFFSKSFSDFADSKVGPEDDEELENYLRYVVSPLDVNFFGGLDDGDEVEISVFDADENRLSSKTYRIFFEGDSFRLRLIGEKEDPVFVIAAEDVEEGDPVTITISESTDFVGDVTVSVGESSVVASIVDGAATVTLPTEGLALGVYTVILISPETETHNAGNAQTLFTITEKVAPPKVDPELTINVNSTFLVFGDDALFEIRTNNTFSGPVTVQIGENTYEVQVNEGVGHLAVSSLGVGIYTAKAIFEATDVFNAAEDNVTFIVEKAQATVNVPLYDTEYDDAEVLDITVVGVEGASVPTGDIDILIVLSNGTIVKDLVGLPLEDGGYYTPIIDLAAGDYNITVTYDGDDNYKGATFKGNFKVNKIDSEVSCDSITFDYGNSGTATATVGGATEVTAVIEGYADAIISIEGFSITVSNLNAGNYDLIVTTIPDMNHTAKTIIVPVTVKRINPNFVIAPIGSVEEGDPIIISISADTGFVGDVTVSVGDNSATVHIADGTGTGTLSSDGLDIGDHTVALVSGETENYNAGGASAAFTIVEKVVPKVDPTLTISVADIVYGEDATIVIGTNNTFSGIVKVQIGENEFMVQVNEGQGQYTVSNLGVGDYTAKAIFEVTDVFNEAEATTRFNVNKADSYVSCDPISFDYGDSGSSTITVEGATVSADNFAVVDHDEAVIIFENNVVTVSNLDAGSYALSITTTPDENHNAKTITVPVTVNKVDATVAVSDFSFDYGDSGSVTATVVGATGITATIDGSADYVTVDGYKITVSGLDAGTYTLSVTAVPDANHNAASATATVTVKKVDSEVSVGPISFDYGGSGVVTATVVGATGIEAAIDGHEGAVKVDGLSITVSDLDAGTYTLTVTTIPDANHNAKTITVSVTVNRVDATVVVSDFSFDYGGSGVVTAAVVGASGIEAAVDGSADHVAVDGDVITVSGLDAGTYTLSVTAVPDADHNAASATATVTVNRINPNFVIGPIGSVEEGDPIAISISADTGFVGDVTVSVGDYSATIHIADGTGTGTLSSDGLDIGDHTVALVSGETKNYNAGEASATVTITEKVVPKVDPALTITVENIVYGEDATIVIGTNVTFSGNVKVHMGENEFMVQVNEGQGQYTISNLGAGDYTVKAIFEATDVFDYAEATSAFVVEKAEATVDVTDVNFTYGGFGIPGVTVGDGVLKLNASVNSDKANVTVNLLSITITGLDAGTYTLTVTTVPDDNHKSVTKTASVTVNKAGSYVSCDDIVFEYGSSGTATVTLDNATGIDASIGGSRDHVSVDGNVITVSGLDAGDYILTVSTVTDGNHKSVTETASVTVNKADSSVSCDDIVFEYGGSGSGTLTVEGATVSADNVAVDGHSEAVIKVENNVITVSNLDPGNYTLTVTAIGDKNHKDSTATVKVTVNGVKERIATHFIYEDMYTSPVNTTKDGRIGNYFVVKLVDANNNPLPGLPIKIGFNGKIYERNITSNGAAHLQINLKKEDVYTFAIYFAGDEDYLGSFAVAKITVSKSYPKPNKANQSAIGKPVTVNKTSTKIKTAIEYEDMVTTTVNKVDGRVGEYFTFKLKDNEGKPIAGKFIQIGFNGNIYNRTTGADGSAKLQINLKKATVYTFAISFLEDDEYQGSFAVAKITVKPQTPKLTASSKSFKASTKTKKISATFKTAYGNAVQGIKVTFTVNGKTYSATTNDKGVATVNVSLTKKGSYSAVAKFAGNTCFKATSTKFTVKIT